MNETDVREVVVRPLLEKLGYKYGGEAYIITEKRLTYARAFLGRKKPDNDPPLRGQADYLCGVVNAGRWVVETKPSTDKLGFDSIAQAHTYAAHPEVAASFFLLTNGERFKLFQTSLLDEPIWDWNLTEVISNLPQIEKLLGPDAMRARVIRVPFDLQKPLGRNLGSRLRIIGGSVKYTEGTSSHQIIQIGRMNGLELPVTGGIIERVEDGRIKGHMKMAEVAPLERELNKALGTAEGLDYFTSAEYLSTDPDYPTLFENLHESITPKGTIVGTPPMVTALPFDITSRMVTTGVGIVVDSFFRGSFEIDSEFRMLNGASLFRGLLPERVVAKVKGTFEVEVIDQTGGPGSRS